VEGSRDAAVVIMKRLVVWLVLLMGTVSPATAQPLDMAQVRQALVRINVISQRPNYAVPWSPGDILSGTGSGFLIARNRILTNAHVVSDARMIVLEKDGDPRRYEARVEFIAHDCDLALLAVDDPQFFSDTRPLRLGGVPALNSTVAVVGYPIGGERLSVTRGVVSRIDFQTYSHSGVDAHLAIQIDAPINPGNSGGPVLQDQSVVGVAFQVFAAQTAQNVGYMIPTPVIQRFLGDVADGVYDRYVDLGIYSFPLINPVLRRAVGLAPGHDGVLVAGVMRASATHGVLQPEDVLLAIDSLPIFADGYVLMDGERVLLNEVVERKFRGDTVRFDILRQGQPRRVEVPLNNPWPYLMQARRYGVRPRYVIWAGIVFQSLGHDFMLSAQTRDVNLLYHYSQFLTRDLYLERPEVVVIGKILTDPANRYFSEFRHRIVASVDGRPVRSLEELKALLDAPVDPHVIGLLGSGRPLVVDAREAAASRGRMAAEYGILEDAHLLDGIVPRDWAAQGGAP
jgi:S1-C subfamily serine protease